MIFLFRDQKNLTRANSAKKKKRFRARRHAREAETKKIIKIMKKCEFFLFSNIVVGTSGDTLVMFFMRFKGPRAS